MAGPLILVAEIARADFSWIDRLRRAHYPAERNMVPAHLTIFRSLPSSAEPELRRRLSRIVHRPAPRAMIVDVMDLGGGVALRVASPDLEAIRDELAEELHGLLSAQDGAGWLPHLTVQNKVAPKVARELKRSLERSFAARPLGITGLAVERYAGGPWERVKAYPFRD